MTSANPYLETNYIVDILKQPIRINEFNQELNKLLKEQNSESWAYITAYNPFSRILSDNENKCRNKKLKSLLSNYKLYKGRGCGIDGKWPPEESFLILKISRSDALKLGKKFKQNAIVFGSIDGIPELIKLKYCNLWCCLYRAGMMLLLLKLFRYCSDH